MKKTVTSLLLKKYSFEAKETGEIELDKKIFSIKPNVALLTQYEHVYLTNQRQGTVATKTRGEVQGSTRKIYKQKGTGRARHGNIRAPIFVGGGIVGGPKPKSYNLKLNKKQKTKALFSALTLYYQQKKIIILDDKKLEITAKTKNVANFLKLMKLTGKKTLFILPNVLKNNLTLSIRNIARVSFIPVCLINSHLIINAERLIFTTQAMEIFNKHFLKST